MLESKAFSFTADCKKLEATIKKVASVISLTATPAYYIAIYRKRVCVIGIGGETFALVAVPDATTKDECGAFSFSSDALCGLIRNRSALEFKVSERACNFSQVKGSYKGTLAIPSVTADAISMAEAMLNGKSESAAKFPSSALKLLRKCLSLINVHDVYQNMDLMSYIVTTEKSLTASSFDGQHFGLARVKAKGLPSLRVALPTSHFGLIDRLVDGADASFTISANSIRVDGKGFIIVLPATQAEERHYEMVNAYVESFPKPLYSCRYDNAKLLTLTENLITLYTANTSFAIQGERGALTVAFTTPNGTASDSMKVSTEKCSEDVKVNADPRLLKDILMLARQIKEPTLVINNKVITINGVVDNISTIIACARSE